MGRRSLVAALVAALVALLPATASAVLLWTLVGAPLTATANQSTTFTLTATNLDLLSRIGCVEVDLPASFVMQGVGTPSASNGDPWTSTASGNVVLVYSLSGGGRLRTGESVTFTILARPTIVGATAWPNHAHTRQDCRGAEEAGVPLAITVLPAATPTPSPSPTSSPTPSPSPTPTPSEPLPSLPLPSLPLPSLPLPTPSIDERASPSPSASPDPDASRSPNPDRSEPTSTAAAGPARPGGSTSEPPGQGGGTGSGVRLAPEVPGELDDFTAGIGAVELLPDLHVWFVPAAAVGVPGLLLIVWVALQAAGALAWIPAVRRMRGDDRRRRRPAHR